MPKLTVSFDDIPRNQSKVSEISDFNISKTSREGGNLGKPARQTEILTYTDYIVDYRKRFFMEYKKLAIKKKIRLLTIRPNDEFIAQKYQLISKKGKIDYEQLDKSYIRAFNNLIPYDYTGSVEYNNKIRGYKDKFIHFHLMIQCSNKQLEQLKIDLRNEFTILHLYKKKQFAVQISRMDYKNIDTMINYYLGVRNDKQKDEFRGFVFNRKPPEYSIDDEITLAQLDIVNEINISKNGKSESIIF